MLMTRDALRSICKDHGLYRTPGLNEKLYANFKGFTRIANLEEYTALRALFLEGNALDSLDGLPVLNELRCLYMQQNTLTHLSHLENLPQLDTLNVSHNALSKIEGLSGCPKLATLIATHNRLESLESVEHVTECKELQTLDLQSNMLSDPSILEKVLTKLPNLKCLYLKGNPVVSAIKNYRKAVIAAIPTLSYLDDRPVFETERRATDAWARGGMEAEREERKKIKEEEEAHDRANFEFMVAMRQEGHRKRRARLGLPDGDTDPAFDEMSDGEYEILEEPPELVAAREQLAAYTAQAGVEEPSELGEARQRRAREGKAIHEGHWLDAAGDQNDGIVYLESVRQSAVELAKPAAGAGGFGPPVADVATVLDTRSKTGGRAVPQTSAVERPAANMSQVQQCAAEATMQQDVASVADVNATGGSAAEDGCVVEAATPLDMDTLPAAALLCSHPHATALATEAVPHEGDVVPTGSMEGVKAEHHLQDALTVQNVPCPLPAAVNDVTPDTEVAGPVPSETVDCTSEVHIPGLQHTNAVVADAEALAAPRMATVDDVDPAEEAYLPETDEEVDPAAIVMCMAEPGVLAVSASGLSTAAPEVIDFNELD